MPRLGVIADDITGGSDIAGVLTREGFRTVQTIGVPEPRLKKRSDALEPCAIVAEPTLTTYSGCAERRP